MSPVRVLIIEDEFIIGQHIKVALEGFGYAVVGHAMDATSAFEMLQETQPDLILLDISLSDGENGIDLAKRINQFKRLPIIYLTSHSDPETMSQAMATQPAAFLTKPFKKPDLYASIELAIRNFSSGKSAAPEDNKPVETEEAPAAIISDAVFVKHNKQLTKIRFSDITFLKSDRVYLELNRKGTRPIVLRDSLRNFETKLTDRFLRIHRSYIINIDFLDAIGNDSVQVDGHELPVGKPYRQDLLSRIQR
ncbi:MAG: response regulator [Bacteroidota bacterium]